MPTNSRPPGAPLLVLLFVAFAACSEDSTSPVTNDIDGDWIFSERLEGPSVGLVCLDTAWVGVEQEGASIRVIGTQSGSCEIEGVGSLPNEGYIDISDGRIGSGGTVAFAFADCSYTGQIAEGDGTIAGTGRCTIDLDPGRVTVTSAWSMRRADFRPPTVSGSVNPGVVSHGDTVSISLQATDLAALAWLGETVTWDRPLDPECPTSPPAVADSAAASGSTGSRTSRYAVPACTGQIFVTVFAADTAGNRAQVELAPIFVELPMSVVEGALSDTLFTLGDTVTVDVSATNARGLSWVGYRWYHPNFAGQDSVAVSGTDASEQLRFVVPDTDDPTELTVRVFARHRLGWPTEAELAPVRTTDAEVLPVLELALPGTVWDWIYSPSLDRVYLSYESEARLDEVLTDPFGFGSTYPLAAPGAGLDLTVSQDTLLVALRDRLAVAIQPRTGGVPALLEITPPDEINIYDARRLRVTATGRALLGIGSGSGGHLVDLDAADGSQTVRAPWGGYGTFERMADRSRVLFVLAGSPVQSQLYLATGDTLLPEESGKISLFGSEGAISSDDAGSRWLAGCQLFTADMDPLRVFDDPGLSPGASVLSLDGSRAYCPKNDGILEFDATTGERIRAIWLPGRPERLKMLTGNRLMAVSGRTAYLIVLNWWRDADPYLQPWRGEAEGALRRLSPDA